MENTVKTSVFVSITSDLLRNGRKGNLKQVSELKSTIDCKKKKDPKTHKGLKRTLLIKQNKTECEVSGEFSLPKLRTTQIHTNHSSVASWILADGSWHESDVL